jgi:REP-associated tyrosine transposase
MLSELPDHKPIRLKPFNYLGQHFYFVTICTFQRRAIFSDTKLSHWLLSLLRMESANNSFNVHAFCLMPDHLLAEGIEPTSDPLHFVKILKIESSRQYAAQPGGVLWQKRFYDQVLRSLESVEPVAWYIWLNPVRKDLVERPARICVCGFLYRRKDANGMERVQLLSTMEETELPRSLI